MGPSGEAKSTVRAPSAPNPATKRNTSDPGDATERNFRYQHAYGVMLMVAARLGTRPYTALWCEHHEDFLAEDNQGVFDAYQIKTSRPERGAWDLADSELTRSIGRFVDLIAEFGDRIGNVYFVSNTEFDEPTPASADQKRRGRSPRLFLEHIRQCPSRAEISPPFDGAFDELLATCGCEVDELLLTLHRMDLIHGPSRGEFDAALSHEHIARLPICREFIAEQLDTFRDSLVALVHRAASLQVSDPIRHLRALIDPVDPDPVLLAKRIDIAQALLAVPSSAGKPSFRFPGKPTIDLNAGLKTSVLEQKLIAAGLSEDVDYMLARARAAEYNLLEEATRYPEKFPERLQQIEQRVHGELSEANLRARLRGIPYGPSMLIDVQDRLRDLASQHAGEVCNQSYECLVGVAGLLTGECRTWWGPRFPVSSDAP